jgi:perosamine synthetase
MHGLKRLDEQNAVTAKQVRGLNDRVTQLPGLSEPTCRPDMKRVYYWGNGLFLDEKKAGMSRATVVKALAAEGVPVTTAEWTLLHTYPYFQEAKWWHHPPANPGELPGANEANRMAMNVGLWFADQPELVEQCARAFEKVWAHRDKLGSS